MTDDRFIAMPGAYPNPAPRDDLAAEYEEKEYEQEEERESLSSGHFSTDTQLEDAVSFLEHNLPAIFAEFLEAFPEWERRTMGEGHSSWFDVETMGVDIEWSSWAVDWVEEHSPVWWEDGEPWTRPGCSRHGAYECSDPDCIRERGESVLAAEMRDAERWAR